MRSDSGLCEAVMSDLCEAVMSSFDAAAAPFISSIACQAFGIVIVLRPTMLAVVTNLVGRICRWWHKEAVLEVR